MGTSINAQRDSESEYVNSVQTQTRILMERSVSVTKKSETLYKLYPEYQEYKRTLKVLHDYTDFVIQKRREELIEEKRNEINSGNHENDVGVKKRLTFLDLLLCSQLDGKPLPNDVIRDEVDTIMFEVKYRYQVPVDFILFCL